MRTIALFLVIVLIGCASERRIDLGSGTAALDDLQARRGVRVRLVLPGRGDSAESIAAGRAAYGDLLEAGVKIYEVQHMVPHSKFIIIDGVWMAIGSSNLDYRSVVSNNEIDAIILGSGAAQGEAVLDQDVALSKEIDLQTWRARPIRERLHEWRARLWEFLL